MLVNEKEALARINSPLNLLNRLKDSSRNKAMSLFTGSAKPFSRNDASNTDSVSVTPQYNPFKREPPLTAETPNTEPTSSNSPKLDDLLSDQEGNIKLAHAHNQALDVLALAVNKMKDEMDNIKPDKLPTIVSSVSRMIEGIRKERAEANKIGGTKAVHLHFYTPVQKSITEYEVIDVG